MSDVAFWLMAGSVSIVGMYCFVVLVGIGVAVWLVKREGL